MPRQLLRVCVAAMFFTACAAGGNSALAQLDVFKNLQLGASQPSPASDDPVVKVAAQFTAPAADAPALLFITAEMKPTWHIYSITQPPGGPIRTQIKLDPSTDFSLGDFKPAPPPEKHPEEAFGNLMVETHEGKVTWFAPIQFAPSVNLSTFEIKGKVYAQACANVCNPPTNFAFVAKLGEGVKGIEIAPATSTAGPIAPSGGARYDSPTGHVSFEAGAATTSTTSGVTVDLTIRAAPADGWHVYAYAPTDPVPISKPTLIAITDAAGLRVLPAIETPAPEEKPSIAPAGDVERFHATPVEWRVPIQIPPNMAAGEHTVRGVLGYQTCKNNDGGCDAPRGVGFDVRIQLGQPQGDATAVAATVDFTNEVLYKQVAEAAVGGTTTPVEGALGLDGLDTNNLAPRTSGQASSSLAMNIVFGFLGGLILNLMPCVFPVIGLKILAFVEQSHHGRGRILLLNVVYSLGILTVFMILATLPVLSRLLLKKEFGWGEQFASDWFNITLAAIVFTMGLSFLGVWEIPIPGFAGGHTASSLAKREGLTGAFCKGIITTLLATPCSGPFLGTALTYAVAEPPAVTFTMFAAIGLGMASPYLLIGAFPSLIRFLPRPGAWMDTFKNMMGFVLLGTTVFLMSAIDWTLVVPTFAFLVGLWAACWWIGRVPLYEAFTKRAVVWVQGSIFAAAIGWLALGPLHLEMENRFKLAIAKAGGIVEDLAWRPLSIDKLDQLLKDEQTVMIDFTADWCLTCKTLEATVLNTTGVREAVDRNQVVTLVADMTDYPEEESKLLELLGGSRQVPVLAIFPAGRPNEPIVLTGGYTQSTLLEKLREAGPSRSGVARTAAIVAETR